ncbi:SIR2 family protein [Nocardia gipuzkoensis]|uniref:SIR2 family protein n=1 Tax=Nocardia gipuzkoensis TaxID=2749991 RepID=UPI003EDF5265
MSESIDARRFIRPMLRGEVLIFLGAGASTGDGAAPSGRELAGKLADELSPDELAGCTTLPDIAGRLQAKIGRYELIRLIVEYFNSFPLHTTELHRVVAQLPVKNVVTTNYDCFMENAWKESHVEYQRLCTPTDITHISSELPVLLKLHGSLEVDEVLCPVVVTSHDFYRHFVSGTSVAQDLLRAWMLTKICIFIGFGLRDPNFLQLFFYVRSLLENSRVDVDERMFAVQRNPNPLDAALWRRNRVRIVDREGFAFVKEMLSETLATLLSVGPGEQVRLAGSCDVLRVPRDMLSVISEKHGNHHRFIVLPPAFMHVIGRYRDGDWVRISCDGKHECVQLFFDSRVMTGVAVPKQIRTFFGIDWKDRQLGREFALEPGR